MKSVIYKGLRSILNGLLNHIKEKKHIFLYDFEIFYCSCVKMVLFLGNFYPLPRAARNTGQLVRRHIFAQSNSLLPSWRRKRFHGAFKTIIFPFKCTASKYVNIHFVKQNNRKNVDA